MNGQGAQHSLQDAFTVPDPGRPESVLGAYAPGLLARIDAAPDAEALALALSGHAGLVRILASVGLPVMAIARAVAVLNRRAMDRLFRLTMPAEVVANSCLIVMGSEGREEQLLRTDQDNGLILRDGFSWSGLEERLGVFSDGLGRLGWPPCPGHVMVTNPAWVHSSAAWRETLLRWVHRPDDDAFMNLAIFVDAAGVSGDPTLLDGLRAGLGEGLSASGQFLARFAQAAVKFATPLGLFGQFVTDGAHKGELDLKKGGIFPIVHGIRALALEAGVAETHTLLRLEALADGGKVGRPLATDLREAFEFLVGLRLKERLHDPDPRAVGNRVCPADLEPDERDELKRVLRTVKHFKEVLTYHFHLEMF